jgi:hypothetical protein
MAHSETLSHPGLHHDATGRAAPQRVSARDGSPWFFLTFGPASMLLTVIILCWLAKASF